MNGKTTLQAALLALTLGTPTAASAQPETAVSVSVTAVVEEQLSASVPAAGTVHSRNSAQLTAGLNAQLEWVAMPGDIVAAGEPVATFHCDDLRLRRDEQRALAQRERTRFAALSREAGRMEQAGQALPLIELERVRTQRDLAREEIRIAEVRISQTTSELRRCTVRAPFSGVITTQRRRGGEDVARGDLLATMTDPDSLETRASVPIRFLPRLKAGRIAEVRLNETRFEGRVRTVVPAADATSQTFEVRIDLPDGASRFVASGQLVSVVLPLTGHASLTVPRDSIVLRADGTFVMLIDPDNRAREVAVQVADSNGDRVSVSGDLQAGDRVAVRGAEAIAAGDPVVVVAEG